MDLHLEKFRKNIGRDVFMFFVLCYCVRGLHVAVFGGGGERSSRGVYSAMNRGSNSDFVVVTNFGHFCFGKTSNSI
jgi:hypothetical protein